MVAEGALFSGMGPRIGWMAIGGFIFFGVYERCLQLLQALTAQNGRRRGEAEVQTGEAGGEQGLGRKEATEEGRTGGAVREQALWRRDTIDGQAGRPAEQGGGSVPEGGAAAAARTSGGAGASSIPEGGLLLDQAGWIPQGDPERIPEGGPRPEPAGASGPVRSRDTLLAGGLAGMATDALLHPIDTIKVRGSVPVPLSHTSPRYYPIKVRGSLRVLCSHTPSRYCPIKVRGIVPVPLTHSHTHAIDSIQVRCASGTPHSPCLPLRHHPTPPPRHYPGQWPPSLLISPRAHPRLSHTVLPPH